MPGRAASTMPSATETSPAMMNIAHVPALSPLAKAAKSSKKPPVNAQIATMTTNTSAVGPGQVRATIPAARSISPSSRWPRTGPARRLLNDRNASRPESMNAFTENQQTRANLPSRPGDGGDPDDDSENAAQDQ